MTSKTPPAPWLTEGRALAIIAAASGLIHLIALGSIPLIVTPDGHDYITWAQSIMDGTGQWYSPHRTPGYPWVLAGLFSALGRNGSALLLMNHLMAWGTCVLVGLAAVSLGGAACGLAAGLLFAVEPWSLVWSTYALTETPTALIGAAAAATALLCRRDRLSTALGLGALLSAACLMRPALQVMVPFVGLAWLLRVHAPVQRRMMLAGALAGAFLAASAPWLAYTGRRGVNGFARGSNWVLWYGTAFHGLLDPRYPLDERTRRAYDQIVGANPPTNDALSRVIVETDAFTDPVQDAALGAWARASILKRPAAYAASAFFTLLWQLNCGIAGKPPMYDEMLLLTKRPFAVGSYPVAPNFQGAGRFPGWDKFVMNWTGGALEPYLVWWGEGRLRGVPQIPLFLAALAATVAALLRREWGLAVFFAGTLALVGASCALLMPVTRYALPAWTLWYIAAAWVMNLAVPKRPQGP